MIEYFSDKKINTQQFKELLQRSSLSERRPIDDDDCLTQMVSNADVMITAWHKGTLVGVARSVTDYSFCCYLSDLAVDQRFQNQGVGRRLQQLTLDQLGPKCMLILLAAPAAHSYYEHLGFTAHPRCWVIEPGQQIL